MEYKKTLNMPKSGFPMRAGLPKREPDISSTGRSWTSTMSC